MALKALTAACLVGALAVGGAGRVHADAGDAIAGAIVGGILGHAIAKDQQRQRTVYVQRRGPSVSSAQRQANRDTQTALNYFGFNAGAVDGKVGPGTRAAVSQFQARMGYPASGWIQAHERDFLMGAYHWASSGGAATTAAQTPSDLLVAYRQRMSGAPQLALTQPMPPATTVTTVVVPPQAVAPEPEVDAAEAMPATLPNLVGADAAPSLASHCNKVSLLTGTNGGFATAATMTDPAVALNEQFCLARTYAIAEGEELADKVVGMSAATIAEQCRAFGPALRTQIAALSLRPAEAVLQEVAGVVLQTGMSPAQLAGTARICLSVGYRTDDMDVALGSALLLTALGERVYGELMGHHLLQGIGASRRPDLAVAWYQMSLDAVENGGRAVFAPGQPDRQALIRAASATLGGGAGPAAAPEPSPVAALPAFAVDQ